MYTNINGYTLAIHFEVTIKDGNIISHEILLRYLETRLIREIGRDINCGKCRSTLLSGKMSPSQIFFRYLMFAKEGCKYSTLLDRIRNIAIKKEMNLQFKYRNQIVRVISTLVFEDISQTTGFNQLKESVSTFCHVPTIIDETILFYCPSVMLSSDEMKELALKNTNLYSAANDTNSTMQQVCIENYFSAQQANSTAVVVYCELFTMISMILLTQSVIKSLNSSF